MLCRSLRVRSLVEELFSLKERPLEILLKTMRTVIPLAEASADPRVPLTLRLAAARYICLDTIPRQQTEAMTPSWIRRQPLLQTAIPLSPWWSSTEAAECIWTPVYHAQNCCGDLGYGLVQPVPEPLFGYLYGGWVRHRIRARLPETGAIPLTRPEAFPIRETSGCQSKAQRRSEVTLLEQQIRQMKRLLHLQKAPLPPI